MRSSFFCGTESYIDIVIVDLRRAVPPTINKIMDAGGFGDANFDTAIAAFHDQTLRLSLNRQWTIGIKIGAYFTRHIEHVADYHALLHTRKSWIVRRARQISNQNESSGRHPACISPIAG